MFDEKKIQEIKLWLDASSNIVIVAHKSPDGDSLGSSLALKHYLTEIGHSAQICHPDRMPDFYNWLPGSDSILTFDEDKINVKKALSEAEIIFCLDFNHVSRVGDMENLLSEAQAKKVMIDHHQDPDTGFFDMTFSFPKISSTCELIFDFIESLGDVELINETIGTAIYCGIMTDTGSFRFPSTTARTHRIIAKLIDNGVKNHSIHENTFDTNSINQIKLNGFALSEKLTILEQYGVAYIALTQKELNHYDAGKGDTEGLVNKALSITGVRMAVFFKEDEGYVKISFRSKGNVYVNQLAKKHFGGGGHMYASGGKFTGSVQAAIDKFVTCIPEYVNT